MLLIPEAILQMMWLTPVANLPPVSLIPVVHLDLRVSPRIFKKFETVLMGYSGVVVVSKAEQARLGNNNRAHIYER